MSLLLCELSEFLEDGLFGPPGAEKFTFSKAKGESRACDFAAVLRPDARNVPLEPKDFHRLVEERKPRLSALVRFEVTDSEVLVSFDRNIAFRQGLEAVAALVDKYGSNDVLAGQIICLKENVGKTATSLTELRILKVYKVLSHLVSYCGGNLVPEGGEHHAKPDINLLLTYKSTVSKDSAQSLILVGTVNDSRNSSKSTLSPADYEKLRTEDIRSMCDNKLETNCDSENVNDLVQTTISFDLNQTNLRKSVILNLQNTNSSEKSTCKGALFVVYNFVRLSTLVTKFQDLVKSSVYPKLPELDETDFTLLTQNGLVKQYAGICRLTLQDEWKIMLDFILCWPLVVKRAIEGLDVGKPKIHVLFKYLVDFSTTFSLYYHRTKILTEPRPHLIPVLHARVHLMLGLLQVVKNAFELISLQPLKQM